MEDRDIKGLQKRMGYRFGQLEYLREALTHPSALLEAGAPEGLRHYERMELLGDAVLSLILAETLFKRLPDEQEGTLAQARSVLGQRAVLSALAQELDLGAYVHMSADEAKAGGAQRASIQEDALEALIGAIYLDSDYETARSVVLSWYGDIPQGLDILLADYNPKGKLQERIHADKPGEALKYVLEGTQGPAHSRVFCVSVHLDDQLLATAQGTSKKQAEEAAARKALVALDKKD